MSDTTTSQTDEQQAPMATDADEVQPEPAKAKPAKKAGSKKATKKVAPKKPALTKAEAVKALKDWSKNHDGATPTSAQFWPARQLQYAKAAKTKAEAKVFTTAAKDHIAAGYPITPQIVTACGSWSSAIEAAGFKKAARKA